MEEVQISCISFFRFFPNLLFDFALLRNALPLPGPPQNTNLLSRVKVKNTTAHARVFYNQHIWSWLGHAKKYTIINMNCVYSTPQYISSAYGKSWEQMCRRYREPFTCSVIPHVDALVYVF